MKDANPPTAHVFRRHRAVQGNAFRPLAGDTQKSASQLPFSVA